MAYHDALAALPDGSSTDKGLLRGLLIARMIYAVPAAESVEDLFAVNDSVTIQAIAWSGKLFWLDPLDTTMAHDGVTCLVTADGYRYKLETDPLIRAVLSRDVDDPPADPAYGEAYLTSAAPSGDWATFSAQVVVYTARGWEAIANRIGALVYVEDEDGYYHYDSGGDWVAGIGASALPDGSVRDTALIGGQRRFMVESRTLNVPPVSPGLGVYWIVGSAPTGAWSGHTAKIATSYDGATWTFIAPTTGLQAFDRVSNANFDYIAGQGWLSGAGAWLSRVEKSSNPSEALGGAGSTQYSYSATSGPGTSHARWNEVGALALTYVARATGARRLRFTYAADIFIVSGSTATPVNQPIVVGVFRDADTTAIEWCVVNTSKSSVDAGYAHVEVSFYVDVGDLSSHTYSISFFRGTSASAGNVFYVSSAAKRTFAVEERA